MNELQIKQAYQVAKDRYAAIGINTDNALERLQNIKISVHCWQGDDVRGFLTPDGELTGDIMSTGNYPARPTAFALRALWGCLRRPDAGRRASLHVRGICDRSV